MNSLTDAVIPNFFFTMTEYVTYLLYIRGMKIRKYYGAGIILYQRKKGSIFVFLERRVDDGSWAIPGGGFSERDGYTILGRNLEATALRELREETGIEIKAEALHIVKTYSLPFFKYAVFASECQKEHKAILNGESTEATWFDIRKLPVASNWMTKIELSDFRRMVR